MRVSVKLTAALLALGVLSGCAGVKTSDRLVCAAVGGVVGGAIGAATDGGDRDSIGYGAAAGAAVAALLCPPSKVVEMPACTMAAAEGAVLDANGCAFDSDNDGIVNGVDQCPGTEAGVEVNAYGCALPAAPIVGDTILSLTGVNFETNSAVLTAHAKAQLDEDINLLADATNVVDVRVEGHTDNTGAAEYNETLSLHRAESVISYLVNHGGVDASKLIAVGMGEGSPAASNDTAEGRSMNRRVDFVVSQ